MLLVKPYPRYKCALLRDKSDIITQFLHFHFELGAEEGNEMKWIPLLGSPRKWRLSNLFRLGIPDVSFVTNHVTLLIFLYPSLKLVAL